MKTKIILLILIQLLSVSSYAQTVHRITSGMNLQDAINAAASGDIFMVEAGIVKSNLDLDKKVTIIGTGYFLTSTQQASVGVVLLDHIRLKPGSDGSFITGIQCLSINISANNVQIKRCYATERIRLGNTGLGGGEDWTGTADNCIISQNYAQRIEIINRNAPTATANNFTISNNIFFRYGFQLEGNISGVFVNNTFIPGIDTEEHYHSAQSSIFRIYYTEWNCKILPVVFRNNIMPRILQDACPINAYPTSDFNGNVFTQDFTNLPSSNVINADPNALFLGYPINPDNALALDARAQLAANSPAKGAGVGGTDAGAFGGDDPYVLSGIPNAPTIYELSVPQSVPQGGTLQVQIKAKTGN